MILFFPLSICLAFLALLTVQLKDGDRKQGKRGGTTHSKATRAESQTQVCCRDPAQGTRRLPTELSGTLIVMILDLSA